MVDATAATTATAIDTELRDLQFGCLLDATFLLPHFCVREGASVCGLCVGQFGFLCLGSLAVVVCAMLPRITTPRPLNTDTDACVPKCE